MSDLLTIPEIRALDHGSSVIRIPDQQQVPTTSRIRNLIDTSEFRRLANISQLGLVSLVYPGATHSRFEHSLGVYRMALKFLRHFAQDDLFCQIVDRKSAELFIVTALLHDLAHWPFCHPIEDLNLEEIPHHEQRFIKQVSTSEICRLLKDEWDIEIQDVSDLLCGKTKSPAQQIIRTMLSGPIDVDKMDYLYRDSLHSGVPYGQNFDGQRLMDSLCLNENQNGIAITDKGRTAAELMVFARYVMFSEVYWHHTVRSATAMFQRAFFELKDRLDLTTLFCMTEPDLKEHFCDLAGDKFDLIQGIFGQRRRLYKRVAEFSWMDDSEIFRRLAHRPYPELVELAKQIAIRMSSTIGKPVSPTDILIDAPPPGLEVQFNIQVKRTKQDRYSTLGEMSPVVKTLATNQFDDCVKRVRIFANPTLSSQIKDISFAELLNEELT